MGNYHYRAVSGRRDVYRNDAVENPAYICGRLKFLQAVSPEELDKLSITLRRLGKLKKFDGYITGYDISDTKKGERVVYASYEAQTAFESGPAKITMGLIRHDVTWQILSFKVESKTLSR